MFRETDRYLYQAALFIMLLLFTTVFTGCTEREKTVEQPQSSEVIFYNWKDFTDLSILQDFEAETGIKVTLKEYETRDMCIAQLQTNPELCDVMILDTYSIPYLKNQKLISDFDSSKLSNLKYVNENIRIQLTSDDIFMPPYLTGTNGFMINTNHVPADTNSWKVFGESRYKNRIILLDDLREALSVVLGMSNLSINEKDPDQLKKVQENALRLRANGVTFGETFTNIHKTLMGEKWIAQTYNGDFVYKTKGRSEFKFVFPKEGFLKWIVTFALHSDAKNAEGAHKFVDYMLRPDISARSATTFSYQSPVNGAAELMPEKLGKNSIINPSDEVLARGETARELGDGTAKFQKIFNTMKQSMVPAAD